MRKIFLFSIVALATVFISSCEKDEIVKEDLSTNETTEVSTLKSGYTTGLYGVNQNYKNAYYHLQQNTNECSWTNYVLATASIIRGKGNLNYPTNAGGYSNKIAHCKSWCNNSSLITKLEDYCNYVDNNAGYPINCNRVAINKDYDLTAAYAMLNHISAHHSPFLYIGSSSGIGHYFTVWSIYWGGSLSNSDVWYTNTLSSSGTFYSMNLQSFLDLNVMSYHNMLFLY